MEGKNGVCSEDDVIKKLHDNIADAEKKIADIIADLPHCEVRGMVVYYNRSTARDDWGIKVTLNYAIM
jgi:hypothetical protein